MPVDNYRTAIEIHGLTKNFGAMRALDGLDLTVHEGEVHGFLGPNGAGKSTTIRVLLGIVRADGGTARLLGGDPWADVYQEENAQHTETLLAGAVDRIRWLASHLAIAVAGPAAALLLAGLVTGLTYGIAAGDVGGKLPAVLGSAAVQLPAVWLLAAVTLVLFGLLPRFTPVAWGVLVGFVTLYLLGSLSGSPQWLLDLEPFAHVPLIGAGGFSTAPMLWLLVIDTALIALGAVSFRHRDLRC